MTGNCVDIQTREKRITDLIYRLDDLLGAGDGRNNGLGYGAMGVALSKFYLGQALDASELTDQGLKIIEDILSTPANGRNAIKSLNFVDGYSGLLSVLQNLSDNGLLEIDHDDFRNIETLIFEWAMEQIDNSNIDFFYGSIGAFACLIERRDSPNYQIYNEKIVDALASKMASSKYNAIINNLYNQLDSRKATEINFSLAHGLSAVIVCLINLYQNGIKVGLIENIVGNFMTSMLELNQHYRSESPHIAFVGALDLADNSPSFQKRLGWCYSDLNLIHILYKAGTAFGNQTWISTANEKASMLVARTSYEETMLNNPFLCHGYFGVSHYYLTLFNLTNQPVFKDASTYWLDKGLGFFDANDNSLFFTENYKKTSDLNSLFYGIPGVLLCLTTAINNDLKGWSKVILL
jgi:lantibiotic biosynthesis protein